MAQDIKQDIFFYGAMNSDDIPEAISDGNYLLAVDISNKSNDADNKVGKVVPRKGNELIDNPFFETFVFVDDEPLPIAERYTVGSVRDESSNKIYYFVYERFGIEGVGQRRFWSIYEFDTVTKQILNQVCRVRIQIFDQTKSVKWGQVLYGNLFWVQDGIEPKSFNIEKAINYTKNSLLEIGVDTLFKPSYLSLTMREFNVIKRPPTALIEGTYENDADVLTNNIRGRLFQFRYRYVYRDNTESVWSPISKVVLPDGEVDADGVWSISNNYNFIRLDYTVDTLEVKEVQIAKREYNGDTNIPTLFEIIHKEEIRLPSSDYIGDTVFSKYYKFFNDVAGDTLSEREENTLYDVVPLSATTMEVISNPDKIVYGGDIVEPSSRGNITTDVSLEVTRFEINDITGAEGELATDFDVSNIRTSLHPYWIENPVLSKKKYHYHYRGIWTAIYIPADLVGSDSINIRITFSPNNTSLTSVNKIISVDISTAATQSDIRDRICDDINAEFSEIVAYKNKTNFETRALDGSSSGIFENTAYDKWRYLDWAFTTADDGHPFQGYYVGDEDTTNLEDNVVFIRTGRIAELELSTSFSEIVCELDQSLIYGISFAIDTSNTERLKAGGDVLGKWISSSTNYIYEQDDFLIANETYHGVEPIRVRKIVATSQHLSERGAISTSANFYTDDAAIELNSLLQVKPTLAPFGEYGVGMVYFDEALRPGYVQECGSSYIGRYDAEYGKAIRYRIRMQISHYAPEWARYWMPVITENKKMEKFFEVDVSIDTAANLVVITGDFIKIRVNDAIGATSNSWFSQFGNTLDSLPEYIWAKGDRIILYNTDSSEYFDKEVIKQDEDYIYVENGGSFTDAAHVDRLIKIYVPKKTNVVNRYFEVGEINEVVQPYSLGRHKNNNNKQNIIQDYPTGTLEYLIEFGDVYLNTINNYKAATGGTLWQPTYNEFYRVFYPSKINSHGRVHFPLKTIQTEPVKDRLRVSYATVDNANIRGWNKFDFNDKSDMGDKYGKIVGLATMGYTLKVITEVKLISIYVNRTVPVNPDGTEDIILTDRTIGGISIPEYNYGCKHPDSIIKNDRNLYYINADNGFVIRDSANGQMPISKYKYESYFRKVSDLIKADNTIKCFGAYNKDDDEYILLLNNIGSQNELPVSDDLTAVVFCESKNGWVNHIRYIDNYGRIPEWCEFVNNTMITFKGGDIWLENSDTSPRANYFGKQNIPYIETIVNPAPKKIKTFRGISIHANDKWDLRESGDISIPPTATYPNGMSSRLKPNKFRAKEGIFYSEFMGDGLSKPTYIEGLVNGRQLRGSVMKLRLRNSEVNENSELFSISVRFNNSEHSY